VSIHFLLKRIIKLGDEDDDDDDDDDDDGFLLLSKLDL